MFIGKIVGIEQWKKALYEKSFLIVTKYILYAKQNTNYTKTTLFLF